jgi:hypothetical protein
VIVVLVVGVACGGRSSEHAAGTTGSGGRQPSPSVARTTDVAVTAAHTDLPTERRVRYPLEFARARSASDLRGEGLAVLLDAEQIALEQVRRHFISRQIVLTWMSQIRHKPDPALAALLADCD